jgi:hypothetical protein
MPVIASAEMSIIVTKFVVKTFGVSNKGSKIVLGQITVMIV